MGRHDSLPPPHDSPRLPRFVCGLLARRRATDRRLRLARKLVYDGPPQVPVVHHGLAHHKTPGRGGQSFVLDDGSAIQEDTGQYQKNPHVFGKLSTRFLSNAPPSFLTLTLFLCVNLRQNLAAGRPFFLENSGLIFVRIALNFNWLQYPPAEMLIGLELQLGFGLPLTLAQSSHCAIDPRRRVLRQQGRSHHVTPHHTKPHHITSRHITSHPITSHDNCFSPRLICNIVQ